MLSGELRNGCAAAEQEACDQSADDAHDDVEDDAAAGLHDHAGNKPDQGTDDQDDDHIHR
jgi:hypothetical protein